MTASGICWLPHPLINPVEDGEGGFVCEACALALMDERQIEADQMECEHNCLGKIHHTTIRTANDHAASLGGSAYVYECECPSWMDAEGIDGEGLHWHVAGSTVSRKVRKILAAP